MATYYVLDRDDGRESTTITDHEDLQDALRQYNDWMRVGMRPVLLQQVQVGIVADADHARTYMRLSGPTPPA